MRNSGLKYSDEALSEIQEYLSTKDDIWDYAKEDVSSSMVAFNVIVKGYTLRLWFSVDKQIFGFDMLAGGCKTKRDLKELSVIFENYIKLNTELVPIAKEIANMVESEHSIHPVYKNVIGNSSDGYFAVFSILGRDEEDYFKVREVDGGTYSASWESEDGTVTEEFIYEDGEVKVKEDDSLSEFLTSMKSQGLQIEGDFAIYGDNDSPVHFVLTESDNDGSSKVVELSVGGTVTDLTEIVGKCIEIQTTDVDLIVSLAKTGKLISLILLAELKNAEVISDYRYNLESEDGILNVSEKDIPFVFIENGISIDDTNIMSVHDLVVYLAGKDKSVSGVDDLLNEEEETNETEEVNEESDEIESSEESKCEDKQSEVPEESEVYINKLVKGDEVVGVQFILENAIYLVDKDDIEGFGLSVRRIRNSSKLIVKNGIELSEDECRLHIFAKPLDDDSMIKTLIEKLF